VRIWACSMQTFSRRKSATYGYPALTYTVFGALRGESGGQGVGGASDRLGFGK
jgi:hypothetical protein